MVERSKYTPKRAVHPGEYLDEELKARGIQKKEFATALGIPASNLSEYLKGRRTFTPDFCVKVEQALPGISSDEWMTIQNHYAITEARVKKLGEEEQAAIVRERAYDDLLNLKELFKRFGKNLYSSCERVDFLQSLLANAGIDRITDIGSSVAGAFMGSDTLAVDERNQRTWILLARFTAVTVAKDLPAYTDDSGRAFASALARGINEETISATDIQGLAQKHGIGYARLEKLEKVPVDAYSTWVGSNPVIVVSYRHNDLHKLIFDVLHEMGHILLHRGRSFLALDNHGYSKQSGAEREANKFAEDQLIPPGIWNKIYQSKTVISKTPHTIRKEAQKHNISPALALRRYAHETEFYKIKGMPHIKIR